MDDGIPLTPSHFICGRRLTTLPSISMKRDTDPDFTPNMNAKDMKCRMEYIDKCMENFWQCWKREYLLNLRECHQVNVNKSQGNANASVGDIVLIKGQSPRSQWKMGRVGKLIQGRDGDVRAAQVKQGDYLLNRPLQHLYPLEIQDEKLPENESPKKWNNSKYAFECRRTNRSKLHW